MFAYLSRHRGHLTTAARLRRITAALTAAALGLLAWAAAPAAFAKVLPPDDTNYGPVHGTTVRVITAGGTPGWQIILIAVAAALVAAAAAVFVDRAWASRRAASSAG